MEGSPKIIMAAAVLRGISYCKNVRGTNAILTCELINTQKVSPL
jgi:hypothetical protein